MSAWDKLTEDEIIESLRRGEEADLEAEDDDWMEVPASIFDAFTRAHVWDAVTERVFTGGEIQADDWNVFNLTKQTARAEVQSLRSAGITHVIDCRGEAHPDKIRRWWADQAPEISFFHAGTGDDGARKGAFYFEAPVAWAMEALSRPGTKVLAHCQCGINRGPSMAAAILMAQGLSMSLTEHLIRQARPCVALAYLKDARRALLDLGWI